MAAGFLRKAINENKAKPRNYEEEEGGSYMVPTSMACPADGCPFPCDTGRAGRFCCMFHTGVPAQFWPVVTDILREFWPVYQMAVIHHQCFNDEDAATEAIHCINEHPTMRKRGIKYVSEAEAKAAAGIVFRTKTTPPCTGDLPLILLPIRIQEEIDAAILAQKVKQVGAASIAPSEREKVRALCARVGALPSRARAEYDSNVYAPEELI